MTMAILSGLAAVVAAIPGDSGGTKAIAAPVRIEFRNDFQRGWRLVEASDIKDRGQILGTAVRDGRSRAVLLTPLP